MKNVRILALSKNSQWGSKAARYDTGIFFACKLNAALYPCTLVVMASESPSVDLDSRKGSAAFFMLPKQKFIKMSQNTEHLALAWGKLSEVNGEQTPKQIKKSLFIILNHLLQFPDTSGEEDEELQDAAFDLKLLYMFMDEIETSTNQLTN